MWDLHSAGLRAHGCEQLVLLLKLYSLEDMGPGLLEARDWCQHDFAAGVSASQQAPPLGGTCHSI